MNPFVLFLSPVRTVCPERQPPSRCISNVKRFSVRVRKSGFRERCAAAWTDCWRSTSRSTLIHLRLTLNIHNCSFSGKPPPWRCSSLCAPHGRVVLTFFPPFSTRDYKKLPSLFPDTIESRLIDLRALSPRLEISQRRAARIDTGRSNKAGRLRGHRGVAHTVTPAITTSSPHPPPLRHTHNLSVRASRLAWFINNNCNKRGNEQRLHNHSTNVMVCALVVRWKHRDTVWNDDICAGKKCFYRLTLCLRWAPLLWLLTLSYLQGI